MTADPLPNAADAEHLTEALRRSGPLGEASVCNVEVMASEPTKSGSHETRRWREMDSNSRSPVRCDTPQRPLITSLAIIFPQSSASPSHRRLRPRRGKILASFSVYTPCKINAPPEAQEAVGRGQELSGGAPRADES